jgi:hypothetical protein
MSARVTTPGLAGAARIAPALPSMRQPACPLLTAHVRLSQGLPSAATRNRMRIDANSTTRTIRRSEKRSLTTSNNGKPCDEAHALDPVWPRHGCPCQCLRVL